jgi:hypothetical protein
VRTRVAGRSGAALGWSVLLVTSLLLAVPATSSAAELSCHGLTPTIVGTDGDDVINGTDGPDIIHGLDGNDVIQGSDSKDIICGGDGNDELRGGKGGDVLIGGLGDDLIVGDAGHDRMQGGKGADTLYGHDGNDRVIGGSGADHVHGGRGKDTIKGSSGNDVLIGGRQSDFVHGGSGNDRCSGNTKKSCEGRVIDFAVKRFLVNQAVASADSNDRPSRRAQVVAGKPGMVRAFIAANQTGIPAPRVELYVRTTSGEVTRHRMTGPATLPKKPREADLSSTFNFEFGEGFIRPGMTMYVKVDRKNVTFELDEGNNRYPARGYTNIKARDLPLMKITVVRAQGHSMSRSEAVALFQKTFQVHPVGDWDLEMYPGNYTCQSCTGGPSFDNWITLLYEIRDLQVADPEGRMYHAIVPFNYGASIGVGGLGFVGGWPAAVSIPNEETVAHETGHNLSLEHVDCGGPQEPDPDYPYRGGAIGNWGYNPATGETYDPTVFVDLMTYCQPEWISDYSFDKALNHRRATGFDLVATELAAAESGPVVQFKGAVPMDARAAAGFDLIPESERFNVTIPTEITSVAVIDGPARPPAEGDHTMVGRDGAGEAVVSVAFQAYAIDHAPGSHFMFSVEIAPEDLERIVTWQVEAAAGGVVASLAAGRA